MKRKRKMPDEAYNADFPARQTAIRIIEHVIEPLMKKGINGELYYALEDKLTAIIGDYEQ